MGYRGLQNVKQVTGNYNSYEGLRGFTGGYKGIEGVTKGYMGLQVVTVGYKGLQSAKRLQEVFSGYRWLEGVT